MKSERKSGVLLHPTSLPGPYGIGDCGGVAYHFVDMLADAYQRIWQVLPLGPVGFGYSPYQGCSAFAGNSLLISPELLFEDGLVTRDDLDSCIGPPGGPVNYDLAISVKEKVLRAAFRRLDDFPEIVSELTDFVGKNIFWLKEYSLFRTISTLYPGKPWTQWPPDLRDRKPDALDAVVRDHGEEIMYHRFIQYLFFRQWKKFRRYANEKRIQFIGDMPIFVSHDSVDVWAYRHLFKVGRDGEPEVVAGVPPDYFSKTGQKWGNPVYRWDVSASEGHSWWLDRFRVLFELVDMVRIDHFRGFEKYWEIPASAPTAENGCWQEGPGAAFFQTVLDMLGPVDIVAEDLGIITPEVENLRDQFGFPGMKVLQFAFGADADNPYLPHNYSMTNCVVYTGTHDNDTTAGWWEKASSDIRSHVSRYIGYEPREIHWDLIRLASASTAEKAVFPVQDLMGLGSESRMNVPGQSRGNWVWRMETLDDLVTQFERLAGITECFGRR